MFVIVVQAALDASLRKFDVLQRVIYVSALYNDIARLKIVLCEAC